MYFILNTYEKYQLYLHSCSYYNVHTSLLEVVFIAKNVRNSPVQEHVTFHLNSTEQVNIALRCVIGAPCLSFTYICNV